MSNKTESIEIYGNRYRVSRETARLLGGLIFQDEGFRLARAQLFLDSLVLARDAATGYEWRADERETTRVNQISVKLMEYFERYRDIWQQLIAQSHSIDLEENKRVVPEVSGWIALTEDSKGIIAASLYTKDIQTEPAETGQEDLQPKTNDRSLGVMFIACRLVSKRKAKIVGNAFNLADGRLVVADERIDGEIGRIEVFEKDIDELRFGTQTISKIAVLDVVDRQESLMSKFESFIPCTEAIKRSLDSSSVRV